MSKLVICSPFRPGQGSIICATCFELVGFNRGDATAYCCQCGGITSTLKVPCTGCKEILVLHIKDSGAKCPKCDREYGPTNMFKLKVRPRNTINLQKPPDIPQEPQEPASPPAPEVEDPTPQSLPTASPSVLFEEPSVVAPEPREPTPPPPPQPTPPTPPAPETPPEERPPPAVTPAQPHIPTPPLPPPTPPPPPQLPPPPPEEELPPPPPPPDPQYEARIKELTEHVSRLGRELRHATKSSKVTIEIVCPTCDQKHIVEETDNVKLATKPAETVFSRHVIDKAILESHLLKLQNDIRLSIDRERETLVLLETEKRRNEWLELKYKVLLSESGGPMPSPRALSRGRTISYECGIQVGGPGARNLGSLQTVNQGGDKDSVLLIHAATEYDIGPKCVTNCSQTGEGDDPMTSGTVGPSSQPQPAAAVSLTAKHYEQVKALIQRIDELKRENVLLKSTKPLAVAVEMDAPATPTKKGCPVTTTPRSPSTQKVQIISPKSDPTSDLQRLQHRLKYQEDLIIQLRGLIRRHHYDTTGNLGVVPHDDINANNEPISIASKSVITEGTASQQPIVVAPLLQEKENPEIQEGPTQIPTNEEISEN